MLIPGDSDWILMLHDGTTVDVKGSDQDILNMVFGTPTGVLRAQLAARTANGVVVLTSDTGGRERAVLRGEASTRGGSLAFGAQSGGSIRFDMRRLRGARAMSWAMMRHLGY